MQLHLATPVVAQPELLQPIKGVLLNTPAERFDLFSRPIIVNVRELSVSAPSLNERNTADDFATQLLNHALIQDQSLGLSERNPWDNPFNDRELLDFGRSDGGFAPSSLFERLSAPSFNLQPIPDYSSVVNYVGSAQFSSSGLLSGPVFQFDLFLDEDELML